MLATIRREALPLLIASAAVGVVMGALLVYGGPVGGDVDQLYRPIKGELAAALRAGRLPYWSDQFGLGVPLLAESHAAAFYPPNLVLYRVLPMPVAYRWAMGLHYLAIVATTYGYARCLGILPWGAAISALSFSLCGFQSIHAQHEPFYQVLPYLPAALLLAERYLATGRLPWLIALSLAFGAQLTLGHFQIQAWTAGLVLLTGTWRAVADRRPWGRVVGLVGALAWGAAIAAVQLVPTWELSEFAEATRRTVGERSFFAFPPAHWAELAIPRLFLKLNDGPEGRYWTAQGTTAYEACLYIGTVPLILAFLGAIGAGRDRRLAPWWVIMSMSFALATSPRWWPAGYAMLLRLPIVGDFRGPARYTALTSLGLCLLAGRGLDSTIADARSRKALAMAVLFAIAAVAWGAAWSFDPLLRSLGGPASLGAALIWAGPAWAIGLGGVAAWRRKLVGPWLLLLLAAVELGLLYGRGVVPWGRSVDIAARSPVLRALAADPIAGRVAGYLGDLPVLAGRAPTFPYLGFTTIPPHPLLIPSQSLEMASDRSFEGWLRRSGTTHGVWDGTFDRLLNREVDMRKVRGGSEAATRAKILFQGRDAILDRLVPGPRSLHDQIWVVVRYATPYPPVRAARIVRTATDRADLLRHLGAAGDIDEVWFLPEDHPPEGLAPRASRARVLRWDGAEGEVEHDGTCDLVLSRTYYPGWTARVDGGPERPVLRVDGGLQAIRIDGRGLSRVTVAYRPRWRLPAAVVSIAAIATALLALALVSIRRPRRLPAAAPTEAPGDMVREMP